MMFFTKTHIENKNTAKQTKQKPKQKNKIKTNQDSGFRAQNLRLSTTASFFWKTICFEKTNMPGEVGGVGGKDDEAREEPEEREKAARKRLRCVPLASCWWKNKEGIFLWKCENGFGACLKYDCSRKNGNVLGAGNRTRNALIADAYMIQQMYKKWK